MRKWKLRVIHLTHTDIGYKDTQERIINNHINYLRDIIEKLNSGNPDIDGWKWTIETFYLLKVFWKNAEDNEKVEFKKLVKDKKIGISANFLNFSEVISNELYKNTSISILNFFKNELDIEPKSFVTNDINGFSSSWAENLESIGVKGGLFGIHTHHGMFPAFKKQYPFWWKLPNGKKMFIWIGEQYAFGNNMGFVPGPVSDYIAKDGKTAGWNEEDQIKLSTNRMKQYIKNLEDSNYEYDIIPISVLGTGSDNDPANFDIIKRVKFLKEEWKKIGIEDITMCTVDEFIEEAISQKINIPEYKGEWPDWWTDGTGSSPYMVRSFREAQRNYRLIKKIGYDKKYQGLVDEIEESLLLFAEHTFGGEDAISDVHSLYHFSIEKLKWWYSLDALKKTLRMMDYIQEYRINKTWNDDEINYSIINPFDAKHTFKVNLSKFMGLYELDMFAQGWEIKSSKKIISYLEIVKHHSNPEWNQKLIFANIELNPNEKLNFKLLRRDDEISKLTTPFDTRCADLVDDVTMGKISDEIYIDNKVTTKNFEISFDKNGICSLINRKTKKELINDTLFKPRYELHVVGYKRSDLFMQRRKYGRNRKNYDTQIFEGKLLNKNIEIIGDNIEITLNYEIRGCKFYEVVMKLHNSSFQIESEINLVKDTEWNMESMFIALPFTGKILLDKDNLYEPLVDQIPGSNIDFHSVQDGIVFDDSTYLACLDNNLIWTGSMEFQKRKLASQTTERNKTYAWILNNLWETNFSPDLGGMHQFRYFINTSIDKNHKEKLNAITTQPLLKRIK